MMKPIDFQKRFWAKVDKNGPDGCWVWTAAKNHKGYGTIGKEYPQTGHWFAHRASWELEFGKIPEGMKIDHICHNRSCVNPSHMRLATNLENSRHRVVNKNNTSGFKGVSWDRESKKWKASIRINGILKNLGRYTNPEDAYSAYVSSAKEHFGDFAYFGAQR